MHGPRVCRWVIAPGARYEHERDGGEQDAAAEGADQIHRGNVAAGTAGCGCVREPGLHHQTVRSLTLMMILVLSSGRSGAAVLARETFAAKLATIKPGMTDARVRAILGAPDDVKTERDAGGIQAARTVEIWRYGARSHGSFATLGAVHIQANHKVQYVFGGGGKPYAGKLTEPELRRVLEVVDAVPSYNDYQLDPRPLIAAVNTLQPLGKDGALAVVDEYLRVSSWLDNPGREGVFLLMRALFDVPPRGMPPMRVGGTLVPTDPSALPRFPLAIVDDVPLKLVPGYSITGLPEAPEDDVVAFRKIGTLRAKPLAPTATALDAIDAYASGPLGKAMRVDDETRAMLFDQALRLFGTVYRPADMTIDAWFPAGADVTKRVQRARSELAKLDARWNATLHQFELPNGKTLPPLHDKYSRVWWDARVANAEMARATFERKSDALVWFEFRVEAARGKTVSAIVVRVIDVKTQRELAKVAVPPVTGGSVSTQRVAIPSGQPVRVELDGGTKKSGELVP